MLADSKYVIQAMLQTPDGVSKAFHNAGFEDQVFTSAKFSGFNGKQFVYSITYTGDDGLCFSGNVFLTIVTGANGPLLEAEY